MSFSPGGPEAASVASETLSHGGAGPDPQTLECLCSGKAETSFPRTGSPHKWGAAHGHSAEEGLEKGLPPADLRGALCPSIIQRFNRPPDFLVPLPTPNF